MTPKKSALQALSVVTTVGLSLGVAAPVAGADEESLHEGGAKDLLVDNVHNLVGGGVNIHADNTCVDKVGDTAHVKFEVQHQPLLRPSATGMSTLDDGYIALPKNLKNVKIGVKALADTGTTTDKGEEKYGDPARPRPMIYDNPVDVPIKDNNDDNPLRGEHELDPKWIPVLGGSYPTKYAGGDPDPRFRLYKDRGFSKKEEPDPTDPNKVITHYLPNEQELRDHIKDYDIHIRKVDPLDEDIYYEGPFVRDTEEGAWYGNNIKDYDIYVFGNIFTPATFEIEADVDVEHDDTFVTAAVSNLGNITKDISFVTHSGLRLDDNNVSAWSRPGHLPPAIPSDPDMIETYKNSLSDAGLDISPRIAPTAEIPGNLRYLRIGNDIHPSTRGDVAEHVTKRFDLFGNKAVTYIGQVPSSGEDGADITAAHVTLCPSEETPTTTKQLIPETETPDKETETPDKETETEKEPTPSTEPKPNGSSLDEETIKKVGLGLGLGLGGSALIKKVKEHRGGSSSTEHTTQQPSPSTTKQPAPTTTVQPAPSTTAQPAPSTTEQAAPAPSTSPAPAATTSRTGTLAQTGANVTTLAVAGSLIVLAGAAFLLVGRRRKEEN